MASGLIDHWMQARGARGFDENGETAAGGRVEEERLADMLSDPRFAVPPPKSLNRQDVAIHAVRAPSLADGGASPTALSAAPVERGRAPLARAAERRVGKES